MKELLYHLIYPNIIFKEMMKYRQICKTAKKVYDSPQYWIFINITNIGTRTIDDLLPTITEQNYLELYNLSGKSSTLRLPTSLLLLINNTKLIIY